MDRSFLRASALALAAAAAPLAAFAGKATLKNGTVVEGDAVPVRGMTDRIIRQQAGPIETTPILMVDAGYKRIFVPDRQVVNHNRDERLKSGDVFTIKHAKSGRAQIGQVGLPLRVDEFDDRGVRTVTLRTPSGPIDAVQGVTEIAPDYVTVEGITHSWWQGLPTAALPPDRLAAMLATATDPMDPDDRMAVIRFYLKAGLYEAAAGELEALAAKFPEMAARAEELDHELRQLRANKLLAELRRRQAVGQHRLALAAARAFPTEAGFDADVLRQVDEIRNRYVEAREQADDVLLRLGELEARLDDPRRSAVAELRPALRSQLDWDTLGRLDAFLKFADDETVPPAERLALAYSGWVVGSAKATTDLDIALALWRARHLVGEYLRADGDPGRRDAVLSELRSVEGVGPEALADLVPLLPPWVETPGLVPGRIENLRTVELVAGRGASSESEASARGPVSYAVVLPPEYAPTRSYPLLVALRPAEWTVEQTASFWALGRDGRGNPAPGLAARAGYVVVVPEYADPKQAEYGYTAREHEAVLAAIRDAKKRFVIDSDRVFLAGHGMGGDATFDLAMAHPDLFAGAVPVSGLSRHFTKYYRENAWTVPFYVLNGELDRSSREVNATDVNWMMKQGFDVIYTEVIGRGYEYYAEELPAALEWMGRLRRAPDPKEFEVDVLRACDDRFWWLRAEGLPRVALVGDVLNPTPKAPVQPLSIDAKITPGNSVILRSAARRHVLRLNAAMIDFEERLKIRSGSRQVFNDFVEPDAAALLDDLAVNGDRQRLYPVRIVVE